MALGTAAGVCAKRLGKLYSDKEVNYVTHKLTHAMIGGISGATLHGRKGFVSGAIGASV